MPVGKAHWIKVAGWRLQGEGPSEIARRLDCSPSAVSTTFTHPEFAEMFAEQQDLFLREVRNEVIRGAKIGVQSMIRLATGEPALRGGVIVRDEDTERPIYTVPHSVQEKASMDLATLAGLKANTTISITGKNGGPVETTSTVTFDFSAATDEELEQSIKQLRAKADKETP